MIFASEFDRLVKAPYRKSLRGTHESTPWAGDRHTTQCTKDSRQSVTKHRGASKSVSYRLLPPGLPPCVQHFLRLHASRLPLSGLAHYRLPSCRLPSSRLTTGTRRLRRTCCQMPAPQLLAPKEAPGSLPEPTDTFRGVRGVVPNALGSAGAGSRTVRGSSRWSALWGGFIN